MQYNATQYNTIQYNTIPQHTVLNRACKAVQYDDQIDEAFCNLTVI